MEENAAGSAARLIPGIHYEHARNSARSIINTLCIYLQARRRVSGVTPVARSPIARGREKFAIGKSDGLSVSVSLLAPCDCEFVEFIFSFCRSRYRERFTLRYFEGKLRKDSARNDVNSSNNTQKSRFFVVVLSRASRHRWISREILHRQYLVLARSFPQTSLVRYDPSADSICFSLVLSEARDTCHVFYSRKYDENALIENKKRRTRLMAQVRHLSNFFLK